MLIGITGKKRSGKDTVANFLCEDYKFIRYSFADPMKKACKILFNFTDEQLWGKDKELYDPRWGTTARKVLQLMGTEIFQYEFPKLMPEYGKLIGRTHWVKLFEMFYEDNKDRDIVFSDVRFFHEIEAIRKIGGEIWVVERDIANDSDDSHASENEWVGIEPDELIVNNGTIKELEECVDSILII